MAEPTKFESTTFWQGTAAEYPAKLAEFAAAIRTQFENQAARLNDTDDLLAKADRLHKSVEAVGEGGYLRLKRPTITDGSIVRPPEGEGDWELFAENNVGEDTP